MTYFATLYDEENNEIPVKVVFSPKRKRSLGMQVKAEWVTVRVPMRTPARTINQFLQSKQQWIVKQYSRQLRSAEITTIIYDDNGLPLAIQHKGNNLPIYMKMHTKKRPAISATVHHVTLHIPEERSNELVNYTTQFQQVLQKRQRKEAVDYLTQRTKVLNAELKLNVADIIVKSYKRKYGQCKGRDISLDWKLIRFPVAISDHIIYHELAHLTHKHHQKSFRDQLKQYDPATPQHKKRLKENGPAMHSDW